MPTGQHPHTAALTAIPLLQGEAPQDHPPQALMAHLPAGQVTADLQAEYQEAAATREAHLPAVLLQAHLQGHLLQAPAAHLQGEGDRGN